jgi:Chaperone of endosialidase
MPLCPQITNTPITVTQTVDFTVTSVVPVIGDTKDGLAENITTTSAQATTAFNTANTALANAATAYTTAINSLQPSAYAIQNPTTKQLSAIDATGLTVYVNSPTSGARVVMNSLGLAGYDSSNNATFSISASTGAAVFSGSVTGSTITGGSLNIAGNAIINSSGFLTATGATITGTLNATGGYIGSATNGWIFDSSGLLRNSGNTTFLYPTTSAGGNANTYAVYSDRGFLGSVLQVQSSSTTALYAPSGGLNVGLGITAAGSAFVVSSTGNITSVGNITSTGSLSTGSASFVVSAAGAITTVGAITASGDIKVASFTISTGTFSSSSTSQTSGTYLSDTGAMIARRDNIIPIFSHRFNATGTTEMIRLVYNGADAGGINTSSAGSPSFRTTSDYRLKQDIQDFTGSAEIIKATRLRSFKMNREPDKTVVGFVAHEFAEAVPDLVMGEKDALDADGNPEYQSILTTNLIPYLTGALKELILKVEELEQRLNNASL